MSAIYFILRKRRGPSVAGPLRTARCSYYAALEKAGVPVEMHLYAQGGLAFGLRPTKFPATAWPQLVEAGPKTMESLRVGVTWHQRRLAAALAEVDPPDFPGT